MRVTRQDWIDIGLRALEQEGHASLSAEKLARRLGVTRGSFYHYFESADAFNDALVEQWVNEHTLKMLLQARRHNPRDELRTLIDLTFTLPIELENAFRAWAMVNPRVGESVARIEALRMAKLTALYQSITADSHKGQTFAKIAYYGLVGASHALPRLSLEELRTIVNDVQELMMSSL